MDPDTTPAPDDSLPAFLQQFETPPGPEKWKTESPASMSEPERQKNFDARHVQLTEDSGPGQGLKKPLHSVISLSGCIAGTTNTLEAIEGLPDSLLM